MNTEKKLIPLLRFPEFVRNTEWICTTLKAEMDYENGVAHENDIDTFGKYIVVNSKFISTKGQIEKRTNSARCLAKEKDILMVLSDLPNGKAIAKCFYVDASNKYTVNQRICKLRSKGANSKLLYYIINRNPYFLSFDDGVKQTNLKKEEVLNCPLILPKSIEEQSVIAECLSSIDSYISSINKKVEQLKAHKTSLLQKLFPQNGKNVPEYRFPEFKKDSTWKKMKLGDVTTVINRRNKSNRSLPIYSISNKDGFVLQSEQFDGLDSESRGYDISLYKIVGRNTFAYNPARINIGSIGYSGNLKEVLISSLYVCFKTTDELDDEFLICFLKTAQFSQAVENNVEGGIRSYLFYENFSRINISIPSLQEQKKIASTILSIDDVISKYTDKVSLLEDYKKGLMQQLFPAITK